MDKFSKNLLLTTFFLVGILISDKLVESAEEQSQVSTTPHKLYKTKYGCICYLIYSPVCGSDGNTYGNSCELECSRKQNPYLLGVCHGACPCCKPQYHNEPITIDFPEVAGEGEGWTPGKDLSKNNPEAAPVVAAPVSSNAKL